MILDFFACLRGIFTELQKLNYTQNSLTVNMSVTFGHFLYFSRAFDPNCILIIAFKKRFNIKSSFKNVIPANRNYHKIFS